MPAYLAQRWDQTVCDRTVCSVTRRTALASPLSNCPCQSRGGGRCQFERAVRPRPNDAIKQPLNVTERRKCMN
ncbi:hypothetical protein VIGAN_02073000 [Vigna angularis var. angularis]|uniref:Uncharacterized protein n=1 Tax=Vigna angularis var. angularis TaxID=157739 RepID=A0A0S3RC46_PHAAN|nr:hypothetical protein VIGAN_02073000 [Vigna angularis var. angularis]